MLASICPKKQLFFGLALLFLLDQRVHQDPLAEDGSPVLLFLWVQVCALLSDLSSLAPTIGEEEEEEEEEEELGCLLVA